MVKERSGRKWVSKRKIEEHIVIIGEPETTYLNHITPENCCGSGIAKGLFEFMYEASLSNYILADSTNTNTGQKKGAIACLEKSLKRLLVWCICCLHLNELPLRHVCNNLIGRTDGPKGRQGVI